MRGKVHDGIDLVLLEELRYQGLVAHLAHHQRPRGHGLPEPLAEVVQNHDPLAGFTELADHVAADVAGAAGD